MGQTGTFVCQGLREPMVGKALGPSESSAEQMEAKDVLRFLEVCILSITSKY